MDVFINETDIKEMITFHSCDSLLIASVFLCFVLFKFLVSLFLCFLCLFVWLVCFTQRSWLCLSSFILATCIMSPPTLTKTGETGNLKVIWYQVIWVEIFEFFFLIFSSHKFFRNPGSKVPRPLPFSTNSTYWIGRIII